MNGEPNRYNDLTKSEQQFFDQYINSVASGGVPEFAKRLEYWLQELEKIIRSNSHTYKHARTMLMYHILILSCPGDRTFLTSQKDFQEDDHALS
jgi:hypothetical protein